jgi:uncharacterized protein YjdB
MKKTLFLLGLLSLAALASCSIKDDLQQPEQARRFRGVLEQLIPDASTKAYAEYDSDKDKYFVFWNQDDRLSIFYDETYNKQFKVLNRDGATDATFEEVPYSGMISHQDIETGYDYAIYPYDFDNGCDTQGKLTVVIPSNQAYYDDARGVGARMLMVARDKEGDFTFKHVGSYIGIRLKGEGFSVASVSFKGNNDELIAGYPKVTFDDSDTPVLEFDPRDTDNSKVITMTLDSPIALNADEYEVFWLQLPALTLSNGLTLTVKDPNGRTYERKITSKITLERKKFYTLSSTVEAASVPVSSVSVSPTTLDLNVKEEATLTATVLPEEASDKTVTWSSSAPAIATVDANGKVTGVAKGTATITATTTDGGKTATCAVTVKDVITYSLALTPATAEINAGATQTYTATLTTVKNGETTTGTVTATLTSSDFGIATTDGMVATGVEGGTATITASYTPEGASELSATATLTVKDVITYSLALTPAEAEIKVGGTQTYTATLTTTKNGTSTTSTVTATLSSSSAAATISGMVATGASAGTATITAKYTPSGSSELSTTASLTVKEDVITYELTIDPEEETLLIIGNTQAFTLTLVTDTNGEVSTKTVTADATWTSSDSAVATITAGTATGVKEGTVTITAKYTPAGSSELTKTVQLKVTKDPNHPGDPIPIEDDENL